MADQVVRLYRPSNGSEGSCFYERFCFKCARDAHMNSGKDFDACEPHEVCSIIGDTLALNVDDPKYPREWQYDNLGEPVCTAFVPVGSELATPRCTKTPDMFEEPT